MYYHLIKIIVITICFTQVQIYAGKRQFSVQSGSSVEAQFQGKRIDPKRNESKRILELLKPKDKQMCDPILGSCLSTLVRSRSFQDKSLKDARGSFHSDSCIPVALQRAGSDIRSLSTKSSFSW